MSSFLCFYVHCCDSPPPSSPPALHILCCSRLTRFIIHHHHHHHHHRSLDSSEEVSPQIWWHHEWVWLPNTYILHSCFYNVGQEKCHCWLSWLRNPYCRQISTLTHDTKCGWGWWTVGVFGRNPALPNLTFWPDDGTRCKVRKEVIQINLRNICMWAPNFMVIYPRWCVSEVISIPSLQYIPCWYISLMGTTVRFAFEMAKL